MKARVIAVTSSDEKADIVRRAGADEMIISPDLKFSGEVWRRTGKQGVDMILENVVTGTFGRACASAAQHAIVVVLGNIDASGSRSIRAWSLRGASASAGSGNATFKDVRWHCICFATGAVKPFIGCVWPFPQVAEGHAMMEGRGVVGRVVLSGW